MKKLSDHQNRLIEKYYNKIYKKIYWDMGKMSGIIQYYGDRKTATDAASGYIVEAAMSFDIDKAKNESKFITWASISCMQDLMDNYRFVLNKSSVSRKRSLYNKTKEKMISEKGYASYQDIADHIKDEYNIKITRREIAPQYDIFDYSESIVDQKDFTKDVEWKDLKEHLLKHADEVFSDKHSLYRAVLEQYLIPKVQNDEYPTLDVLAQKLDCSESRLSQIINGDKMKRMIELSEMI